MTTLCWYMWLFGVTNELDGSVNALNTETVRMVYQIGCRERMF
jgi:hypothetical protein